MGAERVSIPLRPDPARLRWYAGGHTLEIVVWTPEQWRQIPRAERPKTARSCGEAGWLDVRPIEGD